MIRRVLVATDGSEAAEAAVHTGIELARSLGPEAKLHIASVIDYAVVPAMLGKAPREAPDLLGDQSSESLQMAAATAFAQGVAVETHLLHGEIIPALLACAAEIGADILVAGFHGRSRLTRLVMGSVVGNLVRSTDLPVVVVRTSEEPAK